MARVLLLEDEPSVARIIEFKLEREGHEVRRSPAPLLPALPGRGGGSPSPLEGEGWGGGDFDLVLLDLGPGAVPPGDWGAIGGRLVVLVDAADPDAARRAREAGAAAVVTKPFKPTVLARLVRQLI